MGREDAKTGDDNITSEGGDAGFGEEGAVTGVEAPETLAEPSCRSMRSNLALAFKP